MIYMTRNKDPRTGWVNNAGGLKYVVPFRGCNNGISTHTLGEEQNGPATWAKCLRLVFAVDLI